MSDGGGPGSIIDQVLRMCLGLVLASIAFSVVTQALQAALPALIVLVVISGLVFAAWAWWRARRNRW